MILAKRRILHVIDHTGSGGAQAVVHTILRALREEFSFSVAVLGKSGEYSDAYRALDVPVYELGDHGGRWNPLSLVSLANLICERKAELVHAHLFKSCILGSIAARRAGSRVILHDHTGIHPQSLGHYFPVAPVRHIYLYAYRYVLKRCDRVLVLTPEERRAYLEFYSIGDKVTVLPNAVDLDEFDLSKDRAGGSVRDELGLPDETKLVVMVGRLDLEKDWLTFLQVARQVQEQLGQQCGFLVVGSGSEEQRLQDYVKDHNIAGVFFLGNRQDVPALLWQADVFLLTSRRESFGIALLEAMAAGCPVVATRSGGPETIVADGVDGLLAETGDVQSLTAHVVRLLHDDIFCQRLARRARRTVVERYSLETILMSLTGIYRETLDQ